MFSLDAGDYAQIFSATVQGFSAKTLEICLIICNNLPTQVKGLNVSETLTR
jgi:hypothetical protein